MSNELSTFSRRLDTQRDNLQCKNHYHKPPQNAILPKDMLGENEMTFAKNLRKIRGDLTQQDFCGTLGIPASTYQRYETGERVPDIDLFAQIARFFGISADTLLGLDWGSAIKKTRKVRHRYFCKIGLAEEQIILAQQAETIKNLRQAIKIAKLAVRKRILSEETKSS